jgi:hypothetical protein
MMLLIIKIKQMDYNAFRLFTNGAKKAGTLPQYIVKFI